MLCWAAAASNVLAWTGWGGNYTPDAVLRYYATHWTDFGQAPKHAWNWWFNAVNPTQGDGTRSNVDVAGGGFFRNVRFDAVAKWNLKANQSMSTIDTYLHQGYGITLTINNSPLRGCHAITCWGFDYDPNKPGSYRGVWVTDSDDAKTLNSPPDQLRYYSVSYANNVWSLRDYYGRNDWYITEVHGLLRRSAVAASTDRPARTRPSRRPSRPVRRRTRRLSCR